MAGKQGSSPLAVPKAKGEQKPAQSQLSSFFTDRNPPNKTKPREETLPQTQMSINEQTAVQEVPKEKFSLARYNEWLDKHLEDLDNPFVHLGDKTRLFLESINQKYASLSQNHQSEVVAPQIREPLVQNVR